MRWIFRVGLVFAGLTIAMLITAGVLWAMGQASTAKDFLAFAFMPGVLAVAGCGYVWLHRVGWPSDSNDNSVSQSMSDITNFHSR